MPDLDQARLRELLHYDPATGHFTWLVQPNGRCPLGSRAGTPKRRGNLEIKIEGKLYQSGRLAHLYMTGQWPPKEIDHHNGNPRDDRWDNIREATHGQNQQNKSLYRGKNKAAPKGVSWHKASGKFTARITVNGKTINLGLFYSADEAHAAYVEAAERYFGRFARAK